jgi:hypothetical protein
MSIIQNDQIKHEYTSWQRMLEFFRQENALLKYRLSDLVDNNEQNHFLSIAEYFQNELLLKDEALNRLIKSVAELNAELNKITDKNIPDALIYRQEKLRNDILQFEKKFLDLSTEFNEKMLHHA